MPLSYTVCEYKKVNGCSIKCDVYPGSGNGSGGSDSGGKGSGAPVAVYIHGGALIFGGRRDIPAVTIEPFINAGYCIVSIDYRLAPETKLPSIIEDIRDALDWVREDGSKTFGYDASKMAVIGGSAGGYLTLMTGTFERKPKVLVSLYGYGDILGDWYSKPSAHYCNHPLVSQEEAQRLIKDHELSEAGDGFERFKIYLRSRQTGTWAGLVSGYDLESEREKLELKPPYATDAQIAHEVLHGGMPQLYLFYYLSRYCPILNINDDYPPTILLHGDQDTDVPYQQSLDMYNALKARGLTAELVMYAGGGHGFDNDKNDAKVPSLIEKALAFTKAHLE